MAQLTDTAVEIAKVFDQRITAVEHRGDFSLEISLIGVLMRVSDTPIR